MRLRRNRSNLSPQKNRKKHAKCVLFSGGDGELVSKGGAFHCTRTFSKLCALSVHSRAQSLRKSSLSHVPNSYQLFGTAPSCASVAIVQISLRHKKQKKAVKRLPFCWRRWRDLNSRAGCPTYTLSRGASSPLEYISNWLP